MSISYVLIGPPASGKSTIAAALKTRGAVIICPDDLREQYPEWGTNNPSLFHHAHQMTSMALQAGQDVAFDATNTDPDSRRALTAIAREYVRMAIGLVLDTPLAICLERHRRRQSNLSQQGLNDENIERYWQVLQRYPPSLSEGFMAVIRASGPAELIALFMKAHPPSTQL